MSVYTVSFSEIDKKHISEVGGKNASLGELFQHLTDKGIRIPDGFATTAASYWAFLDENKIRDPLKKLLAELDTKRFDNLSVIGKKARELISEATFSEEWQLAVLEAFQELKQRTSADIQVAVRSSATAEDLPTASFAGQLESFLNIRSEEELLHACQQCYASLFTDRAIKYREDQGFEHMEVALSVGVQQMVRSDKACAGVSFTIDPETGFENVVSIDGSWGLGENVVKGNVTPDAFYVFKPSLKAGKHAVINRELGAKEKTMVYANKRGNSSTTVNKPTSRKKRNRFILTDQEIETLARWSVIIEEHYQQPMDIEWAKDGVNEQIYIVQARPETVHATKKEHYKRHNYRLKKTGKLLVQGIGLGNKITAGKARLLSSPADAQKLQEGEILVTDITNPDWDPIMKKAAAIITNKGGRTSHAAIVAREMGAVAVVGTGKATEKIKDGQQVTVSCAEGKIGKVYEGKLSWTEDTTDIRKIGQPDTSTMLILGNPDQAFEYSFLPNDGIGLMRLEFVINNAIKAHPMALERFNELKDKTAKKQIKSLTKLYSDKTEYFVDRLTQGVAMIAAAFHPKQVIVRMSDFKSNEYANLIGGAQFEPDEENPMLGLRGASRYYNDRYKEGFRLECEAIKRVRNKIGLTNVKLMIPFCRTVEEGEKVLDLMRQYGLKQGENGLEIYVMIEIPSNVILADQFAKIFDGFSIGSNDLTQLTLGLDRDSEFVSELFNEKDEAVKRLIADVIEVAHQEQIKIGLCGQAPSDWPEFAQFLVKKGIDSISFNPDALLKGIENIHKAENKHKLTNQQTSKVD